MHRSPSPPLNKLKWDGGGLIATQLLSHFVFSFWGGGIARTKLGGLFEPQRAGQRNCKRGAVSGKNIGAQARFRRALNRATLHGARVAVSHNATIMGLFARMMEGWNMFPTKRISKRSVWVGFNGKPENTDRFEAFLMLSHPTDLSSESRQRSSLRAAFYLLSLLFSMCLLETEFK